MWRWTKGRAQVWCWKFIRDNKRFPTVDDLSNLDYSPKAPNILFITQNFNSINELIEVCGPVNGTNIGHPPLFKDLKLGFKKFFDENGHFPTAIEVDLCPYLITSRSIQRSWGGMSNLRKLMGLEILDYSSGQSRSIMANKIGKRSFIEEQEFEKVLIKKFGEIFVHTQKRIGNINVDFFIYSPTLNFGVDVFNYEYDHDLKGIINLKQKTYALFPFTVIFLPMNNKKNQVQLEEILSKKDNELPKQCKLYSLEYFTEWIETLERYQDPIK